jgi:hypothetical protein
LIRESWLVQWRIDRASFDAMARSASLEQLVDARFLPPA